MTAGDCQANESAAAASLPTPAGQVQPTVCAPVQQQQSLLRSSSSSSSSQQANSASRSPEPKISFHLKTSIFTRRITIDSDKMALGLVKQLAIGFLNEIYFQYSYPQQTYIGDYLRKHFSRNANQLNDNKLQALYDRIILRKYSPDQDSFLPFYSVGDIVQDSYISIDISERPSTNAITTISTTPPNASTLMSTSSSSSALCSASSMQSQGATIATSGVGGLSAQTQLKISHDFHTESYFMPTHCSSCSTLIKGVFKQGFQCASCKKNFCPKCKLKAEATGEGCLAALALMTQYSSATSTHQQLLTAVSSNATADSGHSSSMSITSPNQLNAMNSSANDATPTLTPTTSTNKLEISGQQHANMSKRKSASNLLHFNIANPFKSHHSQQQQQQQQQQQTSQHHQQTVTASVKAPQLANNELIAPGVEATPSQARKSSTSKSMRSSAGALDPILQQLSKQMRLDQVASSTSSKLVMTAAEHQQQRNNGSASSTGSNRLLNVQAAQLSSSHQNLYSIPSCESQLLLSDETNQEAGTKSGAEQMLGCSSAQQSPSKPNVHHQLSNSARNSARDLVHSPTRRDQAPFHSFISMDLTQIGAELQCGVCNKPLFPAGSGLHHSNSGQLAPLMCKTCKLRVHAQCKDLTLADCFSRIAESSRAAAASTNNDEQTTQAADDTETLDKLKGTNSNVSRDNIRLHRLAPSVKHIKRPDLTKPIIEGWLQHKTLSDVQPRRHYWRLDDTDITLYENDTSTRYFKAISVNKITRVISASSLPKQIKEDVALSSQQANSADSNRHQTKSASTSPVKGSHEFKAQMEAMFAFEMATGSVYLVQATDQTEAARWKGSLEAISARQRLASGEQNSQQKSSARAGDLHLNEKTDKSAQEADKSKLDKERLPPRQQTIEKQNIGIGANNDKTIKPMTPSRGHHHHHHHHHYHHHANQGGAYRGQHKTYTDPNRSRLYNRPRIVINLDPMSIPDHWIEGKYLIERNRAKGVGFEELGSGQFGKVYAAISEIKAENSTRGLWSGVPVAIKEISKARFDLRQQAKLKNEANILSRLDHPGVIILERVHDLPDKLYIVMEQLEDDMLEMIVSTEEKRLSERVTKFLTYQILEALKYLHSQNIAHCDLKPENVLLCEQRSQFPQIKLCDFGFAKIIEENSFRSSLVGTPAYLAPEVVKGERYNRSVDLWSVGVIVYVSLSGEFPFNEGETIHDQISRANFMYPEQPWARISAQAKSFINSLLRVNSDRRLSANRAQMDNWIQDYQLWCDLCELELRVGQRWVTDDADFERWSRYARQHQLQLPRSAVQLHQEFKGD